jgi:transposase
LIQIRAQAQYEALQVARKRQNTDTFKDLYAARAGIEGTISQGTRIGDLRRSRYIGLPKTRLHHLLLAAGINLLRVCAWLADVPRSQTRRSAFAVLG